MPAPVPKVQNKIGSQYTLPLATASNTLKSILYKVTIR